MSAAAVVWRRVAAVWRWYGDCTAVVVRTPSRRIVGCYKRVTATATAAGTHASASTFATSPPAYYCRRRRRPSRRLGARALPFSSRSPPIPVTVSFTVLVASTTET